MSKEENVIVNIPKELSDNLKKVAMAEKKPESFYIQKGIEQIVNSKLEDIEDYEEAKQAYEEFIASGENGIPFDDMKKELDL